MAIQDIQDVEQGLAKGSDPARVLLRVEREGAQRYVVVDAG
jgi:hypothetical protein